MYRNSKLSQEQVVNATISAISSNIDIYNGVEPVELEFPLPGMLDQYRHGVVLRFDPAFATAYTGRRGTFLALVRAGLEERNRL